MHNSPPSHTSYQPQASRQPVNHNHSKRSEWIYIRKDKALINEKRQTNPPTLRKGIYLPIQSISIQPIYRDIHPDPGILQSSTYPQPENQATYIPPSLLLHPGIIPIHTQVSNPHNHSFLKEIDPKDRTAILPELEG